MTSGPESHPSVISSKSDDGYFNQDLDDHVSVMLAYWDRNLLCRYANRAYLEWCGRSREDLVGRLTMPELLGQDLFSKSRPYVDAVFTGEPQVFEREVILRNGKVLYALVTYQPHLTDGIVQGFMVQVVDITALKIQRDQARILDRARRHEVLRSIIDTRERELESVAAELRDNISQTLAYCKMLLHGEHSRTPENGFFNQVANYIHVAIHQLNSLSGALSPSFIHHFGFREGLSEFISNYRQQHNRLVLFRCECPEIEELAEGEKVSLFRIIQDYLQLVVPNPQARELSIDLTFGQGQINLCLRHNDPGFLLPRQTREFADIWNRIEFYEGSLAETIQGGWSLLQLEFSLPKP